MSNFGVLALFLALPALGVMAGGLLGARKELSPLVESGVQHFAAGVVFAAIATEIIPTVMHGGAPRIAIAGFMIGVAVMFGMRVLVQTVEARERAPSPYPLGFIGPVAIDCVIDGAVIGAGFASGAREGLLIASALTLEMFFLGLATAGVIRGGGGRPAGVLGICVGLGALLLVSAAVGLSLLSGSSPSLITGFLAFGSAALLYLVTEELLIRAHGGQETNVVTALFYIGFLAIFAVELFA